MSGSQSSGLSRESYDDRSVSLIVSGNVSSMGAGHAGGDFDSMGFTFGGALFQGDMFLSGALRGRFDARTDEQFGPNGTQGILGLAGDRIGLLDGKGRIREGNTGEGLFGRPTFLMVTGSHLAASASATTTANMRVLPNPYHPNGPEGQKNYVDAGISLFHGDVFSSGSLYSFGGEIRLGRPTDGRSSWGHNDGGAEGNMTTSYQVGLLQVNSMQIPSGDLEAGDTVKMDIVSFNPGAQNTVAAEAVKYLISLRDNANSIKIVYDGTLSGIYDSGTGKTRSSFTYTRSDVTGLVDTSTDAYRALDSLELEATNDEIGDVVLTLTNTSSENVAQSVHVRVMKQVLTV